MSCLWPLLSVLLLVTSLGEENSSLETSAPEGSSRRRFGCEDVTSGCRDCLTYSPTCYYCATSGTCQSAPLEIRRALPAGTQAVYSREAYEHSMGNSSKKPYSILVMENDRCDVWLTSRWACMDERSHCRWDRRRAGQGCSGCLRQSLGWGFRGFCAIAGSTRSCENCVAGHRDGRMVFRPRHFEPKEFREACMLEKSDAEGSYPEVAHPQSAWFFSGGDDNAMDCVQRCRMAEARFVAAEGAIFMGDSFQDITYATGQSCSWEVWPSALGPGGEIRYQLMMASSVDAVDKVEVLEIDDDNAEGERVVTLLCPDSSGGLMMSKFVSEQRGRLCFCTETCELVSIRPLRVIFTSSPSKRTGFGSWNLSWTYVAPESEPENVLPAGDNLIRVTGPQPGATSRTSQDPKQKESSGYAYFWQTALIMFAISGCACGLGCFVMVVMARLTRLQNLQDSQMPRRAHSFDIKAFEQAMPWCRPLILGQPIQSSQALERWKLSWREGEGPESPGAEAENEADINGLSVCCVCLGHFVRGQEFRGLPCGHAFHRPCIDPWLYRSAHCPSCRRPITEGQATPRHPAATATSNSVQYEPPPQPQRLSAHMNAVQPRAPRTIFFGRRMFEVDAWGNIYGHRLPQGASPLPMIVMRSDGIPEAPTVPSVEMLQVDVSEPEAPAALAEPQRVVPASESSSDGLVDNAMPSTQGSLASQIPPAVSPLVEDMPGTGRQVTEGSHALASSSEVIMGI
eukprot:TRINITY_DN509_c0_g1_i1.p1 TRINITY_DN509_c0_g1~~TRINITY_DN509_c0_g1_i1.p1  ORF type:complete len:762 (+),score=97.78 TRINITY_DN509_c0_g1_i1:68-2287(+)